MENVITQEVKIFIPFSLNGVLIQMPCSYTYPQFENKRKFNEILNLTLPTILMCITLFYCLLLVVV